MLETRKLLIQEITYFVAPCVATQVSLRDGAQISFGTKASYF
jgi:hypothetical protein